MIAMAIAIHNMNFIYQYIDRPQIVLDNSFATKCVYHKPNYSLNGFKLFA